VSTRRGPIDCRRRPFLGFFSPTAPIVLPPEENLAGCAFLEALISSYASWSVRGFVGMNGRIPLPSEPEAPWGTSAEIS
jgi:hypothetical protein